MVHFSLPWRLCLAALCVGGCSLQEHGLGEPQIIDVGPVDAAVRRRDAQASKAPNLPNEPVDTEVNASDPDADAPNLPEQRDAGEAPDAAEVDAADAEVCTDDAEPAMEVMAPSSGSPPSGPYEVVVEVEPSLSTHTILRPRTLDRAFPVLLWDSGACARAGLVYGEFLQQLSSYGFVSIVAGSPYSTGTLGDDGAALIQAMDWAEAENQRPCGKYEGKLDTANIASMGASCGGGHALSAAADPRVTTTLLFITGGASQATLNALHQPVAYFGGGQADIAAGAADSDYKGISKGIPVFSANLEVGPTGTFLQDNGGAFADAAVAWLRWRLQGTTGADTSDQFEGKPCGLEQSGWTVKKKNMK